jgi:hypothetical protein
MNTQEAIAYLSILMEVEEYNNYNYTKELDLERLFKAKQHFVGRMTYVGQEKTKAVVEEKRAEAVYELKLATIQYELRQDLKKNGQKLLTETEAKNAARADASCQKLREIYIQAYGEKERLITEYNILKTQVDAISQYIAYLRDEKQRDNFLKSTP